MKYLNEVAKSSRYEKIHESVENQIHKLSENYIQENGTKRVEDNHGEIREYELTEEKLDDEAYEYACEKFMRNVEDTFGSGDIYWIFEIMLADSFDYTPSKENPYAVRKPTVKVGIAVLGFPYVDIR